MTGPWGTNVRAAKLALDLKPQHVLPIHDWHWREEAKQGAYDSFEKLLAEQGITFHKLENGKPVVIKL
jgi:L-ascorbate metabolism protein UlaG (beta-lactamase superfamily)